MPKTMTSRTKSSSAKPRAGRRRTAATATGEAKTPAAKRGAAAAATAKAPKPATSKRAEERLKPGQLDGLVLAYLKKHAPTAPHGPSGIGKALGRSSGAVANCLVRLARDERVVEVSERPRRYRLAG